MTPVNFAYFHKVILTVYTYLVLCTIVISEECRLYIFRKIAARYSFAIACTL